MLHNQLFSNGLRGPALARTQKISEIITQKKVISTLVDITFQTVKNSGPSERKAVQD